MKKDDGGNKKSKSSEYSCISISLDSSQNENELPSNVNILVSNPGSVEAK
jgi:hypothetical protein